MQATAPSRAPCWTGSPTAGIWLSTDHPTCGPGSAGRLLRLAPVPGWRRSGWKNADGVRYFRIRFAACSRPSSSTTCRPVGSDACSPTWRRTSSRAARFSSRSWSSRRHRGSRRCSHRSGTARRAASPAYCRRGPAWRAGIGTTTGLSNPTPWINRRASLTSCAGCAAPGSRPRTASGCAPGTRSSGAIARRSPGPSHPRGG